MQSSLSRARLRPFGLTGRRAGRGGGGDDGVVGAAVDFGGWTTNIDVSQASQGLAGGRSFSEAKGS